LRYTPKRMDKKYNRKDLMNIRGKEDTKRRVYLAQTFANEAHAKRAAKNAINLYNEVTLHLSLDYKIPNMVYKLLA
jgi:hypothetical protein